MFSLIVSKGFASGGLASKQQGSTTLDTCELPYTYATIRINEVLKIKLVEREVKSLNEIDYMEVYKMKCKELKNKGLANKELNNYDNFKDLLSEEVFKEVIKTKHNRQQKRSRTKNKFKELYILRDSLKKKGNVVFITIDPSDEMLNKKENTYIRKIHLWLKKHFIYSILNKEYGETTGREHYHALALTTEPIEQLFHEDGKPKKSDSGYDMYELVNKDFKEIVKAKKRQFEPTLNVIDLNKDDFGKTTNYFLKLNNHSNKKAAKGRIRVIKGPLMRLIELRYDK